MNKFTIMLSSNLAISCCFSRWGFLVVFLFGDFLLFFSLDFRLGLIQGNLGILEFFPGTICGNFLLGSRFFVSGPKKKSWAMLPGKNAKKCLRKELLCFEQNYLRNCDLGFFGNFGWPSGILGGREFRRGQQPVL